MATIVVFGGTGYTGGSVVREAAARDHHVISVSRSEPQEPVEGVRYEVGSVQATASPSMDIQVSSNFERALFDALGLVGSFEQPRHLSVRPHLCAHARNGATGCARQASR